MNVHAVVMFLFLLPFSGIGQPVDILLKGGHVIDPKNKIDKLMDIAITAGKIYEVAVSISPINAKKIIDVTGMYVTPGIIDMHVHAFYGTDTSSYLANGPHSIPVDAFTFRAGVTTVVDAGSSGWKNFRRFKAQTIDKSKTRVLAFLNIVGGGMYGRLEEQDVTDMNPEMAAYMITHEFPELIVGIKSAHYWGDFTQVDLAEKAGELAKVPVMVDFGEHKPPNSIEALFTKHMRPGDIFTHTYANGWEDRETVVDTTGTVKPFVFTAQQHGINFDVGHGGGAFSWVQAVPSIRQHFWANTISTDLHSESMNSAMKDMSNVMSKFYAMGMPLYEVILRSTWNPAIIINKKELGSLSVGSVADVAVFTWRKGDFGFLDVDKKILKGKQKLETELTIRAGKIVWDLNGIGAVSYEDKTKQ